MTNDELKSTLEGMLSGSTNEETIFLLLDSAIHAAILQKMDLSGLADIFTGFVGLHQLMLMLGIPPQVSEADPFGQTLYTPRQEQPKTTEPTPEEKHRLNNLLRDIKFEL